MRKLKVERVKIEWLKVQGWKSLVGCLILTLVSCTAIDQKLQESFIRGEELYVKHCSNCHQTDGTGLGLIYPPVDESDYLEKNLDDVICLMEYGTRGELMVNGKSFNKAMPGIPSLTDLEIAEISTYLYNNWGREKGLIDEQAVVDALKKCNK